VANLEKVERNTRPLDFGLDFGLEGIVPEDGGKG